MSCTDLRKTSPFAKVKQDVDRADHHMARSSGGLYNTRQKTKESASSSRNEVFDESTWLVPISESVPIVDWVPTQHCDKGEAEESNDQNHLEDGEIEFK